MEDAPPPPTESDGGAYAFAVAVTLAIVAAVIVSLSVRALREPGALVEPPGVAHVAEKAHGVEGTEEPAPMPPPGEAVPSETVAEGSASHVPPATKLPAADGPPRITVRSTPRGVVYIDGEPIGTAPLHGHRVSPGSHRLEVRLGGHETATRTMRARAGVTEQISFQLKPTTSTGTLSVASTPASVLYVDGDPIGTTPLDAVTLPAGKHVVELRLGGHSTHRQEVDVPPGQAVSLDVGLKRAP